jgi:hypothetical protein
VFCLKRRIAAFFILDFTSPVLKVLKTLKSHCVPKVGSSLFLGKKHETSFLLDPVQRTITDLPVPTEYVFLPPLYLKTNEHQSLGT